VASTLDLVGDRWTLVVVRDLLLFDKHRFGELLASGERVSTNILADRLARLERAGLVTRRRYRERPPRDEYHLTPAGRDLRPLLMEMVRWANAHLPSTFEGKRGTEEKIGTV
jgi:DNA-binding HxlR family transcriptional regulator